MSRLALRTSLVVLCTAGSLVVCLASPGCSSSTTDSTPSTTHDTGTSTIDTGTTTTTDTGTSADDTGTSVDDTGSSTTDSSTGSDGGTGCGSDPTLHPVTAGAGVFCPGVGDGGTSGSCASGEICCDTPKGSTPASSCIAAGGTCPTTKPKSGSSWACDAPSQCGSGKICCGEGTPTLRTGCTYDEVFPAKGTVCATSCSAAQYIVCESAADCPSGKTCTPMKSGAKQIGYCK